MHLKNKYKCILSLILAISIVLSGIVITDYPSPKQNFLRFGSDVMAETVETWTQKASCSVGRYAHSAVAINGIMYVFGGKTPSSYIADNGLWAYNPNLDIWTKLSSVPSARKNTSAAVINGKMYIFGGYESSFFKELWEYDPAIGRWTQMSNGPSSRAGHSAVEINGKMYIFGGGDSSNTNKDLWEYDPVTDRWEQRTGASIGRRYHSAVAINGKMYIFGGVDKDDYKLGDLWEYDPINDTWTQKLGGPDARAYHSAAVMNNKMYIFGGHSFRCLDDLWEYDPENGKWTKKLGPSTFGREYHSAVAIDGKMYVFGSYDDSSKELWEYSVNNLPEILVNSPIQNQTFSETDISFIPQVSVSDSDNNNLTCKYYIDSETTPRETKMISNTITAQIVNFYAVNMNGLAEGNHTIKYEISDGITTTPVTKIVSFKVDKSAPILGPVTRSSTINTISISGSGSDGIGGLDGNPYRYTIGLEMSGWINSDTYTSQSNLLPNTLYTANFEIRDVSGHISSSTQNIYTKAAVPSLSVNNASSYTLDIVSSDNNSAATQYQISINNGTQYVTQEGTLTSAPSWITLNGQKVTVKGLNSSSTYTFTAKARNAENIETAVSSAVTGTTLVAPPGSPSNIIATSTDKTVTVSWDAVSGAIGYDIEADGVMVNTNTATTYTHINLNPGTPHTYRVRAKNAGGPGNWSAAISKSTLPGSPDIPQNINAIPLSTSVTITWNNVPGATGYDIEVDGVLVNNGPNTNYIHSSLAPGTHHSYCVRSINPGGKSEWSGYVNTTTLLDTVPVPVNITAVPSLNNITLSWNAVNGASGYDIEVDGVTYDNSTRTTYTHSNLAAGTQHIYRIRAKKGGINSEWSAAIVSSTLTNAFGTPVNFKANAGDTSVALSWDPVPEAEGYEVEIDGIAIDNGIETTCIHNGLLPGSNHTYRVRAKNAKQTSEWAQPLTVTIYTLQTPQNVTATSDETSITIAWDAVNGATSYDIDFDGSIISDISAGPDIQTTTEAGISVTTEAAITTTYTVNGLTPNTQHVIKVRAVNESGVSNWSTPLTQSTRFTNANVPVISGLAKKTSVTVMWNSMEGAVSYDVEADGSVTSNITGTAYNAAELGSGTQHTYRVRAQNSSGAGNWSEAFTVSTLPQGPAAPSNIATSSNMTSILLTWDKVAGAEEYEIEVDGNIVNNGAGTSYLHTGLTPDTDHTYRIRSKNVSGYSDWSPVTTVKTVSSVQTFDISSTEGEEFDLVLSASNIQELDKYTFTIQYNTEDFEVTDLCGLTVKQDTQEGDISGTDITVRQIVPGTIVFTKAGSAQSWQVWSGVVNSITFKAKHDGQATITYTIQ